MRAIPRTTRVPNRLGPAGRPRRSRPAAQRFDVRPHAEETSAEVPTNPPSASRSSSLSSHPAAQRFDVRTNALIAELERIQDRIGIARSTCVTAQGALEGSGVPGGIDIGRALGFGASTVLSEEYGRLYALIHALKEGRPLQEWIGRWRP